MYRRQALRQYFQITIRIFRMEANSVTPGVNAQIDGCCTPNPITFFTRQDWVGVTVHFAPQQFVLLIFKRAIP